MCGEAEQWAEVGGGTGGGTGGGPVGETGGDRGLVAVPRNLQQSRLFFNTRNSAAPTLTQAAISTQRSPKARPTHPPTHPPDPEWKTAPFHSGSLMDTREKSEEEQLQFACQSYHVSLLDEAPLFPVWSLRGSNCSVSLAYIWTASSTTHMTLINLMAICRKCFR